MIKRFVFYFFLTTVLIGSLLLVYANFKPKDTDTQTNHIDFVFDNEINTNQLKNLLNANNEPLKIIFYDSSEINSKYLFDTILKQILNDKAIKTFRGLYYVDTKDFDDSNSLFYQNLYGYTSIPSLVSIRLENGATIVDNSLNNNNSSLTYDNVLLWLQDNGIVE